VDGQAQRTLLLFVIRDHIGTTPLQNLQSTLTQELYCIWESLSKPVGLANAKLVDYFDLAFEALPHKVSSLRSTRSTASLRLTPRLRFLESDLTVENRGRGPWSWSVVRGL
jgi:hypothetical protein